MYQLACIKYVPSIHSEPESNPTLEWNKSKDFYFLMKSKRFEKYKNIKY